MKISQTDNPKKVGIRKRLMSKIMQEKLAITVLVIMLALFALIIRIYFIQKENEDDYNQKVLSQQQYDSRDIPYQRGDIVDRKGTYLATSQKVYNLIIDANQINSDQEDYLEPTVALLSEVFGYSEEEIRNVIIEKSKSYYIRYEKNLSFDKKEEFESRQTEINQANAAMRNSERVYGVWFEDAYVRSYPYGTLACNLLGFSSSDGTLGIGGIEEYYNTSLIGTAGREYGYLNDESNLERVIKSATNGNTIVSTIDVNIQKIVEKYIAKWEEEAGSDVTAVVMMDPNTGEILAMATSHLYDLNNPRDLSGYYTQEEIDVMDEDAKVEALNQIWRNFIVSDSYEPGSPSKVFTVASAIEKGTITGEESYYCDGFQDVGGYHIRCVKRTGHGMLTVTEALMQSCNDVMMQISAAEGKDDFYTYQEVFGFGQKTGIDLPGEADTSNLIHTADNAGSSDLATNSFGQNVNVTMLQMVSAFCSVVNGGTYYEPHVVKQILSEDGSVVENIEAKKVKETVSEYTTNFMREALRRTVEEGTGAAAKIEGYDIGGKTGTAEKYPRGTGNYLVSFIGCAPSSNPEVVCYVIIDTPHVEDQPHSSYASGIFKNIMEEVLPYMGIFPEGDAVEESSDVDLPISDGITDGSLEEEQEVVSESESIIYETDEYIAPEDASDSEGIVGESMDASSLEESIEESTQ